MLFCLRGLRPAARWNERLLRTAFWSFNTGLGLMALLTLLPMGILQVSAAIQHGYWYARSADFMQQPLLHLLVWLRVPGDVIFSLGACALAAFIASLWLQPRTAPLPVAEPGTRTR